MLIPGSNVLNQAFRLIAKQTFQYKPWVSRTTQPNGQYLATYGPVSNMQGSVQAVPRNLYEAYGLDFQKHYIMVYVPMNLLDITRDVSGDQIIFNGKTFQCLSKTDWKHVDGWISMLAVELIT